MTGNRRRSRASDSGQLSLGLGSGKRYKLFFAVMPPADIVAQIGALTENLERRFGLSVTPRIPHVTVYGLGDYAQGIPHDMIAAVSRAIQPVRARAFDAVFDGVQLFAGPREALVLRCGKGLHGFVALQNAIGNALAGAGADRLLFDSSFTPHLTLFYDGGKVPELALEAPICWRVETFELILSLQGHRHYEPFGSWMLQG